MQYPDTELVLDKNGNVYHLGLSPENIASKIILVGDQNRVNLVAENFSKILHRAEHREFRTVTGIYKDKKITVLSTGIGTDNIDITLNELDALVNINIPDRKNNDTLKSLDLIRIGTCGILQEDIEVESFILSTHAIGLDNVAHFYEVGFNESENKISEEFQKHVGLPKEIIPYAVESSSALSNKLKSEQTCQGITVTSSGFYGPQGRELRIKTKTRELNDRLSTFSSGSHRVINFEMESSALFALGKSLGHRCATICLGIANRPKKSFSSNYTPRMRDLIIYVLDRI